jgi:hypothetical protein
VSDKWINLDKKGYTDSEAAKFLFPQILRRHFWAGLLIGILAMAAMDITDLHICVGECDGEGLSLTSGWQSE